MFQEPITVVADPLSEAEQAPLDAGTRQLCREAKQEADERDAGSHKEQLGKDFWHQKV